MWYITNNLLQHNSLNYVKVCHQGFKSNDFIDQYKNSVLMSNSKQTYW